MHRSNDRFDDSHGEIDLALDRVDDRQVSSDGVWTHHHEEIWETREASSKICRRGSLTDLVPLHPGDCQLENTGKRDWNTTDMFRQTDAIISTNVDGL